MHATALHAYTASLRKTALGNYQEFYIVEE